VTDEDIPSDVGSEDLDDSEDGGEEWSGGEEQEDSEEDSNVNEEVVVLPGGQQFMWKARRNPSAKRHTGFTFSGHPGLTEPLVDVNDTLECFERFVDDAMINVIVVETNRRAAQILNAPGI